MVATVLETAPYAPPQNILEVLHHVRRRSLLDPLDSKAVKSIGVPEGNVSRTLAAFRFLKLIDDDEHCTDTFDRLARVPEDQYPEQLAQVLREAYKTIFTYWEPSEDDQVKLSNLFRQHYNPQAQRTRMVTLFVALCREANILIGPVPESRPRAKRTSVSKDQGIKRGRPGRVPSTPDAEQVPLFQSATVTGSVTPSASAFDTSGIDDHYALCLETMKKLPADHCWTRKQRLKWLQAITACVDLLVEVSDDEDVAPRNVTRDVTVVEADRAHY